MEIDPNRKADNEMKSELENQKNTKPTNIFFWFMLILGGLMIIAMIGAFWSSNSKQERNNMGIVTPQDTAIVNKSDTLKQ
ncbi:MAG: hypothetical protein H7339_17805 [Arcicella sp.]|nr:hypothetical protein [Arcicella sp.]